MRYQSEQKEKSREQIVKAARKVFADVGFESATIDRIMTEAGLTRGGFYKHFPTKLALFTEVIREAEITPPEAVDCTVHEILARYVDDDHAANTAEACPLFTFPNDVARQGDEVKQAYENVASSITKVLAMALPNKNHETALAMMAMSVGCMVVMNSSRDPDFQQSLRSATLKHIATLVSDTANP